MASDERERALHHVLPIKVYAARRVLPASPVRGSRSTLSSQPVLDAYSDASSTRLPQRVPVSWRPTAVTTRSASGRSRRRCWREPQLHLRPCAGFTPHRQLPPISAARSGMPRRPSCPSRPWSASTFGSIPLPSSARAGGTARCRNELDLDPSGLRVPEGIAKGFRRNLVVSSRKIGWSSRVSPSTATWNAGRRPLAPAASSVPSALIASARLSFSMVETVIPARHRALP